MTMPRALLAGAGAAAVMLWALPQAAIAQQTGQPATQQGSPASGSDSSQQGSIVTKPLAPLMLKAPQPGAGGDTSQGSPTDTGAAAGGGSGKGSLDLSSRFKLAPNPGANTPVVAPELIPPVPTVKDAGAKLRVLDKMTGRTETVDIASGAEKVVERLRILVDVCRAPDDKSIHGTKAFLQIWDKRDTGGKPVFSGWMLADSPALSAMDHPRYDVWVISCTTSPGAAPVAKQ